MGKKEALNLEPFKSQPCWFWHSWEARKKGLHSPLKFNFSKKKKKCIFSQTENKVFWKLLLLHFLKKKMALACSITPFQCLCAEFFSFFYIDHSNFTNLTRQRSCYICWQAVYSKCQSHATTCWEKRATFSSIENRSAKPTCQTVNALKISSLSSKEVRFYLVKKELRHMTTGALLHFGRYSNLESCFY